MDIFLKSKEFEGQFCDTDDLIKLDFKIAGKHAVLFYIDGMLDKDIFERSIICPLKNLKELTLPYENAFNMVTTNVEPAKIIRDLSEAVAIIADGDTVLIVEGAEEFFVYSAKKYSTRGIQEPPTGNVLRGPREGFTEDLKISLTQLRRRLRTNKLVSKNLKVGVVTQTNVAVVYVDGIADKKIIDEITEVISNIDIDGVVDSSYLARFLEPRKHSIFKQVGMSEKPDIVAAKMLEGRVAVVVDGSPMVLTLPFVVLENFQDSEDYFIKNTRATLTRTVRLIAMFVAIILPSVYVALLEFQYHMLPLSFLSNLMKTSKSIPFTPAIEMLVVLVIFEILSEASVRMPRHISMALAVVGAIVLGETAVNAQLLSTPTVLVTALSTIGLYCMPDMVDSLGVIRLLMVVFAGVLGIFGVVACCLFLIAYMVGLENYGTNFMAPFTPGLYDDLKDTFYKADLSEMKKRPFSIPTKNRFRQKNENSKGGSNG